MSILSDANEVFAESQVIYSLIVRNRTPLIKPGDTLEIAVLFSGHGIPLKNKLITSWSSTYIIDKDNPGTIEIGGGNPVRIDPNGSIVYLPSEIFSISPIIKPPPDYGFPLVRSETYLSGKYPIFFKINTAKTAPSGDYDIAFVFTYSDNISSYQDYNTISFHISNFWERNQLSFQITAVVIALMSLITGTFFSVKTYRKTNKKR